MISEKVKSEPGGLVKPGVNETDPNDPYGTTESTQSQDFESSSQRERDILQFSNDIFYSKRYNDEQYIYRHVILPKQLCKYYKADRLLSEAEWRSLGLQQSPGWIHYMIHKPEPHVLLFRREMTCEDQNQLSTDLNLPKPLIS